MASLGEHSARATPLGDALGAGLDSIRYGQEISFTPYVREVLPLDGFVFWIRADLVSVAALASAGLSGSQSVTIPCSLHATTETVQNEDESLDMSQMIVTTQYSVREFHDAAVNVLWVGDFSGIRFAINSRTPYYRQADLHHYTGQTLYPAMASQFIDDLAQLNAAAPVLSNSTALWLGLAASVADLVWLPGFSFPLYPKYLLPDNLTPPYGVIAPDETTQKPIMSAPRIQPNGSRNSLVQEDVDIILYGCAHEGAADFLDTALGYGLTGFAFGITNSPTLLDEYRTQAEANILAQKKRIRFSVNYYQSQVRDMTIMLITECIPSFTVEF